MYSELQEFKRCTSQFLTFLDKIKGKSIILDGFQSGLLDLHRWQMEENDALEYLSQMSEYDKQLIALSDCQSITNSLEKDVILSLNNYMCLNLAIESMFDDVICLQHGKWAQ